MPNHCLNNLDVSGPAEDVAAFVKATESHKSLVDAFVPMPKELEGTTSPFRGTAEEAAELRAKFGGFTDWYEWQNANWGVKWGDYDTELLAHKEGADYAQFLYTTAWGPMAQAIASISKQFPTLLFEVVYVEEGCCLLGATAHKAGELVGEASVSHDEWPTLVELPNGDYDWDAHQEALRELSDRVISEVGGMAR